MLLIILLAFALLALTLAEAAPGWITAIQRQREQTAINYARQYCMGIRRYYHKFGSYPPNLDRLKATNDVHYLRRAWPDPLAKDGKWYFIHPGDLIAPKVKGVPGETTPGGPGGPGAPTGGAQSSFGFAMPGANGASGAFSGSGFGANGANGVGGTFGGMSPTQGFPSATGASPLAGGMGGATTTGGVGFSLPAIRGGAVDGIEVITGYRLRKQDTTFASIGGGPIIGVAILNDKPAVHEFNGKDLPEQWLFIYDPAADRSLGGAAAEPPPPGSPIPGNNNPFGNPPGAPTSGPTGAPSPNPGGGGPSPNPTGGTDGLSGSG